MKLVVLTVVLILISTYYRADYKSKPKVDKWNECSIKVSNELTEKHKDKNWDTGVQTLPFDILYHYILGKTYACVKDWDE